MTNEERIIRYQDLLELKQSRGYKWLSVKYDDLIKEQYERLLLLPIEESSDRERLEIHIRIMMLVELKNWIDEEITRFRSAKIGS